MPHKIVRLLIYSQVSLFVFLGICFALIPHFLLEHNEGGVSNYGVHNLTILPYTLAFFLCALFVLQAAYLFPRITKAQRQFSYLLYTFMGLLFLVLITTYPYKVDRPLETLHLLSATILLLFETAASIWLALLLHRDGLNALLLAIQLSGFLMAILTFAGRIHLLFTVEIVTSLAFGLLLIHNGHKLLPDHVSSSTPRS